MTEHAEMTVLRERLAEAGLVEVYRVGDRRNLGHWHTDRIGDYVGDDLSCIPVASVVEWTIMDAGEYGETVLANCSGDGADYVCDETGKVLLVQFMPEAQTIHLYRVYRSGMECKANGHEITDSEYITAAIDYTDSNPVLLGEFDMLTDAIEFAEKQKNLRRYEFSSPSGRCFAFDWVYVQEFDVEYDEDGDVESEEPGDIYREFISEN